MSMSWTCNMDIDIRMDMDMQHEHRDTAWTWICSMNRNLGILHVQYLSTLHVHVLAAYTVYTDEHDRSDTQVRELIFKMV